MVFEEEVDPESFSTFFKSMHEGVYIFTRKHILAPVKGDIGAFIAVNTFGAMK